MAQKKNYHTIRYGNSNGEIKFGHIHKDNVLSAAMIRSGADYRHYITMDSDDKRPGWTTIRCPGVFNLRCGDSPSGEMAMYFEAVNGDITFNAPRGRIRFAAENIDLVARGGDNKNGVITIDGNEKVLIKSAGNVTVEATGVARFFSSGTVKVIGDSILELYGGLIESTDGATKKKKSKAFGDLEIEANISRAN